MKCKDCDNFNSDIFDSIRRIGRCKLKCSYKNTVYAYEECDIDDNKENKDIQIKTRKEELLKELSTIKNSDETIYKCVNVYSLKKDSSYLSNDLNGKIEKMQEYGWKVMSITPYEGMALECGYNNLPAIGYNIIFSMSKSDLIRIEEIKRELSELDKKI